MPTDHENVLFLSVADLMARATAQFSADAIAAARAATEQLSQQKIDTIRAQELLRRARELGL